MYSVKELAGMYGCTRVTVYKKLKHEDIKEYLHKDEKGLKLQQEGLNVLNILMADSNVKPAKQEVNSQVNNSFNDTTERYIVSLEAQIEELKRDKERLFDELKQQRLLLTGEQEKRKGFLQRLFSK